jgi:hypothetical protein
MHMTHEADDLLKKIEIWINREGYPFEMRVAQAFRKAGFIVTQSEFYKDPVTGLQRELDIVATVQKSSLTPNFILRLEFPIECKVTSEKPWLLLCSPEHDLADPGCVAQRYSSRAGIEVLSKLAQRRELRESNLFRLQPPVGYSLVQALGNENKDAAYSAIHAMSNALQSMATNWDEHPHRTDVVEIMIPTIVLSGRLFHCSLLEEGNINVSEITRGTLAWRHAFQNLTSTIINLVTINSVDAYAIELCESAKTFLKNYFEFARQVVRSKSAIRTV